SVGSRFRRQVFRKTNGYRTLSEVFWLGGQPKVRRGDNRRPNSIGYSEEDRAHRFRIRWAPTALHSGSGAQNAASKCDRWTDEPETLFSDKAGSASHRPPDIPYQKLSERTSDSHSFHRVE